MSKRVIAFLAVVVLIIASAGISGYFVGGRAADSSTELGDLREKNLKLEGELSELRKDSATEPIATGVLVELADKPGYSRYVSPSGLTFVIRTVMTYQEKEYALAVNESANESGEISFNIFLKDLPEVSQVFTSYVVNLDETPSDFTKSHNLADEVQLFQIDDAHNVRRYQKVIKRNSLPVNTYATDGAADDLRVIEFTDRASILAAISYPDNKLFGEDLTPFINSIEMIK